VVGVVRSRKIKKLKSERVGRAGATRGPETPNKRKAAPTGWGLRKRSVGIRRKSCCEQSGGT